MANYIEEDVKMTKFLLLELFVKLLDYKCPDCGSTEISVGYGKKTLFCLGKCQNSYNLETIIWEVSSINKPLMFHPKAT